MTYTTIQKLRLFFTIIIGFLLGPFYSSAQCTLDATISGNTSLCNGSTTLTATATGASSCSPNEQVGILYNLDDCAITYGSSTSVDYGTTCGVNLTDKDMLFYASVKGNSCGSPGAENSFASMCGSGTNSTFFRDPTYPANGFNFTVSGVATTSGKFSKLSFYISEPTTVPDIYSSTKFGIRITDPTGSIVYYEQAGLTVPSTGWQLFSFDFSSDTDFNLSSIPKDYKVFIQGYAPGPDFFISGGQIPYSILEIDQVRAYYSCPSSANTTYSWSGPNGFTSSQQSITASTAGTYYVTVRDCNGCSVTKNITVTACGTCDINTIVANPTACNSSTNTYSTNGTIYFSNPPNSGTLTVSDGTATKTFSAPFTSPLNYTLTGLTANGATHTVTASFSATNCYQSTTYTAPQSCSVVSCNLNTTISGNTTLCSGSTTLTANATGESTCSSTQANIGFYSLDGCDPLIPGTLTATYPQTLDCVAIFMSDLLTYNDDFSCTSKFGDLGAENSYSGACVKSSTEYSFNPSNGKYNSFNFDAVSINEPARISKISFYARGLTLNSGSYATKMGVRILKNGVTIFEQTDITVNPYTWTPYTFDVSSLPETILGSIYFDTYTVIVQGYYPNSTNTAPTFEMDQIRVYAQCGTASGSTTYAWTGPNGFTSSQQTITATTTGTYTVTVRDCNGCTVTKSVTVTPPPTPTVAANPSSICAGSSTTLTVSNCSGSVTWNDGTTGLTKTVSPTSTTTYTATCSVGTCTGTATSTVTVTPKPTPTVNSPTICSGSSTTLTVSNCSGSVTWNDGTTGLTKTVSPTSTTTYTATCSVGTCTGTATSTVTVTPNPTPTVNSPTICAGSSTTLTVSNCSGSVTWNDGTTGLTKTVSPTSTTTYTATCSVGTCTGTATSNVTVTPNPTPTVNSPTICAGSSTTLTVSNCSGSVTWNDGTTGLTKTVSPTTTTTYTATCSVGTCSGTATSTVTVTPKPTPTVNNPTICAGSSATLTVSNCSGSVTWNDGTTGLTKTVSPTTTTTYTATCSVGTCTGTATSTVTVTPKPTPTVNSPTICSGSSTTLTVSNCSGSVTWNDGTTGLTKTVSPTSTTTYTATCSVGTCTGTATSTVTVIPKPTPMVNSPTICAGSSATLTISNCSGSVTWNDGTTGLTKTVSPTTTTTYTATCSVGTCTGTATSTVTVTPKPTPTVNSPTICAGSSATLTISNCSGSVTWNDGTTGLTKTVSPTTTTTYTATCSVGTCTGTATSTVTVTPKPTPTVNSPTICAGSSATLTVSNCSGTVTWNDGVSGASKTVSPTTTTTYTATCSVGTCTGTATSTVTVTPKPTPTVNSPTICAGSSATLTVSNCSGSVTWNDGTTGLTKTVSPTSTTTYTATCSIGTCTGTATSTVTVTPKPTPTPTVNNVTICTGGTATLTVSNCNGSISWNTGATTTSITVSPTSTTSYTVACTEGTAPCIGTASATGTVTVSSVATPTPSVNSPAICVGQSATLTVTNCSGTVTWNDGTTGLTKTVSPTSTTSYTVTCTVSSGSCSGTGTASATVTVTPKPAPTVNSPTICAGSSATLTVSNCSGSVTWNDGTTGLTKTVSPTSTTTYTATCSVGTCTGTATSTVTVTPKPTPTVNSPTICSGSSTTLTVSNCSGSVTWNDGTTGLTKTVSPTTTITYTATCSVGTCTGTATSTVTVTPKPTPMVNSPTICAGSSTTLTVSNCSGSVTWNDGTTGLTKTVSPTTTTTYTATCSVGTCTGTATSTVTVTPKPTPTVNSPTICAGSSATLTVSNCSGSVTWNDGTTGLTKTVSPTTTTTYTATCSVGTCTGTATSTVTVTPKPMPTPTVNNVTICTGGTATLTVSNCNGSISWNTGATTTSITVSPTSTTSYTVTCTEGTAPCIGTATATGTVTISSVATPTPSVNSPAICLGQSATLTVSNCSGTGTWNDGTTGLTKTVSPTSTTSYTVTCTVSSGSCSGTGTATSTVTVTPKPTPTPTVNNVTICTGGTATLTVSNCNGSISWNTGATTTSITVNPTSTTSYTVTCTEGTAPCIGSATATGTVTVSSVATPTPSVNSPTICTGQSATLTVTNCSGTVTWNDGTTGLTKTVSPTSTTTYTATCTVSSGSCSGTGTASATVTVTPKPTPTVNSPTICAGSSATLTVSNCSGSVTWNDGTIGLTKTVSPTSTTTYTATCSVGTCTGTATSTVTVTPKPTPTVNSPTICSGNSATLTVSNCSGSVTWNDGTTGLTKTVSPASTTTYTATCSVGTCTGTATSTVTVTSKPTPTPTVNNVTICTGGTATLTVSNCNGSISWNTGATTTSITVSPTITTNYTVSCTEGTAPCIGTATATGTVTISSVATPTPSVNSPAICLGQSATLTVTNCSGTVTWNDGTTGLTKTVSPTSTTSTVTCTVSSGSCSGTGTATSTVTVTPKPTPTPTVNNVTICTGGTATLTVSNCNGSISWNTGATTTSITVSPTSTTSYTVTCTEGTAPCIGTATATGTVTISSVATPTPSVNSPAICVGQSATLTVTNCSGTVTWNDGTTGLTKTVSPTSTTSYTATCTVSSGSCSGTGTASATVTVTPKPTPTVNSPTICAGSSATLTVSNCSGSVTWNDGTIGLTKTVSPTSTTIYTATCSVGTCTGTATSTVTVTPKPTPTVNNPTICAGSNATLTVSNCSGSVIWNDGTTGLTKTVSPTSTTTYTATCSVGTCTGTATSTVTVTPKPTVTINTTITCSADLTTYTITFTSNGIVTSDKGTVSGTTVSGIPTGQTVTLTASLNGCTATASATKSCNCPTINPPVGASKEICEGDATPALTVTVDAGLQADWYSTATSTTKLSTGLSYIPTVAGDFYVEAVNPISGCKSATRTKVSLVVNPKPTLSTLATCATDGLTYSVTVTTNATSITADKGTVSGMSITGIPSGQTVTITATSVKGCTTTATANQSCIVPVFDLALMKKLATGQTANVVAGGTVKFTISIINQGNVDATNVQVSDYIPTGLTLNDANWTATSGIATLNTPITSLAAGQTVTRDITFTVGSSVTGTITNFAEISSASNALNLQDVDSTPDANATNDGTPKNDVINENGKTGGDEDDHDLESINVTAAPVFDLALMKKLATGQTANVVAGGTVKFTISIINQGNVDATNVQVSDYIPIGLTLNDANWTATSGIATLNTPITSLAAGQTVTRDVTFTVGSSVTGIITNFAEISSASNAQNLQDIDSTPDANATNDGTPKNDVINENGKIGGDEDDHDLESINVSPSCVLPTFKVASPSVCETNTWSVSIIVSQVGSIKINKGTLSGSGTNYTISNIPAGTSLVMMDSLSVSCKKDTIIAPPISCNCITSPPVIGQNLVACKGDTFPTLKATVVGYGTVDWYKQSTGGIALAVGTLSYKPAGVVAANDTFYLQARNLAIGTCPDPSLRTQIVVYAQNCTDTVDLALKKMVDKKSVQIGDVVTYTIKVWNESNKNATGVEVTDQLPAGVQYVSYTSSIGTYSNTTGIWTIGNMDALPTTAPIIGDTVTLSIKATVITEGVTFNTAEISKTDQKDKDSTPGNGVEGEDDIDRVCITTPIKLCAGQGVDITIPSTYTGIIWKNAQGNIIPSNGNVVTFTKAGTYTFTATNGTCPTGGCCPVIVEEINCCPAEICIPFTITKRRK